MQIVNRTQRRLEKKNFTLPLFILAVAAVSFALGVTVGSRRSGKTSATPPVVGAPAAQPAKPAPKDLTFYDTLPRGEQVPLGSGINLPREAATADLVAQSSTSAIPSPAATNGAPEHVAAAASAPAAADAPAPATSDNERWFVQVASYKAVEDARKMQERLGGKDFKAIVREADLAGKGKWYRVVIGPLPSEAEANRTANRLQNEGINGLVRKD